MSADIYSNFEVVRQAASQCAPVFAGVKPSNIFIIGGEAEEEIKLIIAETGITGEKLYEGRGRRIYLFYREDMIERILKEPCVIAFLKERGYNSFKWPDVLQMLKFNYGQYWQGTKEFPHEIGMLLGYPLCDVTGFIEHRGKNFLMSGYWKVYGNAEETKKLFDIYTAVKMRMVKELECGKALGQIISSFYKQKMTAA